MKILQGQGVSKGVEHGPIYFCRRSQTLIQPDKADDPRFQGERLDRAMEQTAQQLGQMAELARAQAGDSAAQLFETHAMFLEDEDYTGAMEELLAEGYCAEYAVDQAGEQFSAMLAAMDDPYMQARACDVKDVTGRILNNLTGVVEGGHRLPGAGDPGRRRPSPLRDHPAGQEQDSGHRHPGRLREQPYRHPGPHYGHPRGLRPGGQL